MDRIVNATLYVYMYTYMFIYIYTRHESNGYLYILIQFAHNVFVLPGV